MLPAEDIIAITQNVFSTVLASPVGDPVRPPEPPPKPALTGSIHISGQWQGSVLVSTTESFADHAAEKMLGIDNSSVAPEDRVDVLAELTNMIGGNIKSLLPGPSNLSLPSVAPGTPPESALAGAADLNHVRMSCVGEEVNVIVRKN